MHRNLLFAALIGAATGFLPQVNAAPPVIGGCQIMPANNYWNTPIDQLPVHPLSNTWVASIGATTRLHPDWGNNLADNFGIPYDVVPANQPNAPILFNPVDSAEDESDQGPFPIPPNAQVEGGLDSSGDRHVLVVQQTTCMLYELYSAYPKNGGAQWEVYSSAKFDLNSNALRPLGFTSADAAGYNVLPGLVRWEEIAAGEINHAIRFTAANIYGRHAATGARQFIWPARHWSGNSTDATRPPMGARFRLKASFDISGFHPTVQVLLRAFKKYGIFLADAGSNWYFSGTSNANFPDVFFSQLKNASLIKGSDFEAVDTLVLQIDPNSAQAAQVPSAPVNVVVTPGNGQASFNYALPNDGGKPIITNVVTCNPGAVTGSATGPPILVSGLTNGVAYTCTARAANVTGFGAPSSTLDVTVGLPAISVSAMAMAFPAATVNTLGSTQSLLVTNTGVGNLVLSNIDRNGTHPSEFLLGPGGTCTMGTVLAQNQSCSVPITFAPTGIGLRTANLVIASNVAGSPTTVTLSGSGRSVPGAPAIGTSILGDGFVYLVFAAPASDGGAPIVSYTATCVGVEPASATRSPILINGLTNGVSYTCSVTATNSAGTGPASATVMVTPTANPPLAVIEAVSLKSHGAAGSFGVPARLGLAGDLPSEPRFQGAQNHVVFRFNRVPTVTFTGEVRDLNDQPIGGLPIAATVSINTNEATASFGTVPEGQKARILLLETLGGPFNAVAEIAFLVGDVNSTQRVTAADIAGIKSKSGQMTTGQNFRTDVNRDGFVSASDVSGVKVRSGSVAP
jgi:hypothetical protein